MLNLREQQGDRFLLRLFETDSTRQLLKLADQLYAGPSLKLEIAEIDYTGQQNTEIGNIIGGLIFS